MAIASGQGSNELSAGDDRLFVTNQREAWVERVSWHSDAGSRQSWSMRTADQLRPMGMWGN
jgi:hypothetical protein